MNRSPAAKPIDLRRRAATAGQAVVEFVLGALVLFSLLFGLIDFGRAIYTKQILTNLSREGANLASRGTPLASTLTAIKSSATPLNIDAEGYLVLTTVARDSQDRVTVTEQRASGGQPARSRLAPGGVGSTPALPATAELLPQRNQTMYVAEVYYRFELVTPVGRLLGLPPTSTLYDAAVF